MRLLIIGSLNGRITAAAQIALARGAKVSQVDDVDSALANLRAGQGADLVMIDVDFDIARFVGSLRSERIHVPVVACGIGSDAAAAVRAIKAGAKEYIPLPPDAELIAAVLAAVTEESRTIVFRDPSMGAVLKLADQVAASDASILVCGESGTGKELLARYVHRKSRRANAPMVSVNCAAIPENLLESELFGHEKGAFTGAVARRIGKFEEANGGTLLLDEISEMDPRLQAKLLRAVQEREIDRVGGTAPIKVDIRVLATSNRDLEAEVRAGRFREDLYFRLNVVTLTLPPLRERPADIDALVIHFVEKYSAANGIAVRPVSAAAAEKLRGHAWRGNVRELENVLHRAVLLAKGDAIVPDAIVFSGATRDDAPAADAVAPGAGPRAMTALRGAQVGRTVADVERDLILDTLNHCLGNRTHAANILGISIRTMRNKLKLYSEEGVTVPLPREAERAVI
ncbi:MAG: sigma-54-dependent Fis family transcriptional regulator [Proteobacteria bacterium]|nr:sigma-54-dependent Fis family transcriptional regulator [Pseudomonadota bacterium]